MAEDWKSAYGRERMVVQEYEQTIVPALMERIRELEKGNRELAGRLEDAQCELKRTRAFIHEQGMEFALMARLGEEGDPWGTQR